MACGTVAGFARIAGMHNEIRFSPFAASIAAAAILVPSTAFFFP